MRYYALHSSMRGARNDQWWLTWWKHSGDAEIGPSLLLVNIETRRAVEIEESTSRKGVLHSSMIMACFRRCESLRQFYRHALKLRYVPQRARQLTIPPVRSTLVVPVRYGTGIKRAEQEQTIEFIGNPASLPHFASLLSKRLGSQLRAGQVLHLKSNPIHF